MNANVTRIAPLPPRVPSDWLTLLTYQHPQNRVQARRVALSAATEQGVDLDGATLSDEL